MALRDRSRVTPLRFAFLAPALFVLLGVGPGRVIAADSLMPGQIDAVCASACGERGYDSEYCARACSIPPPGLVPSDQLTDLRCQAKCRKRGGTFSSCHRECSRS